jgi:hypothetical protein
MTNTATDKTAIDALADDDEIFVDDTSADGVTKSFTPAQMKSYLSGKQTIWIPAAAMIGATTNGAASAQIETTTNVLNYKVFDFDSTADEYVCFDVAFPKSWDEGTVTFQVFWESTATNTDGVAFGLQGVFVSDGVASDTAYGTAIVVTDNAQTTANLALVTSVSSAVTISGTPAVDGVVNFRLLRDVSDAGDDMTEDARVRGVKLFFTTDTANDD